MAEQRPVTRRAVRVLRTAGLLATLAVAASAIMAMGRPSSVAAQAFDCRDVFGYFADATIEGRGVVRPNGEPGAADTFLFGIERRLDPTGVTYAQHVVGEGDGYQGTKYRPATDIDDLAEAWKRVRNLGDEAGGTYYEDVAEGVAEVVPYLNDRARACPDEVWVLGGYAKGAHVMGNVLRAGDLSAGAEDNIAYVGLLGDPKLPLEGRSGPLTSQPCVGTHQPWVHGDVPCWAAGGVLGGADPYVPVELQDRVGSWCRAVDSLCAGDEARVVAKRPYAPARYSPEEAVHEAVVRLARRRPDLPTGAFDTGHGPAAPRPRVLDVALVVDTTASMAGVLDQARISARAIADVVLAMPGSRVSLVEYKDVDQGDPFAARVDVPFTDDVAVFQAGLDGLTAEGGGADGPEAAYSGLVEAFDQQSWSPSAMRIAVVATDTGGKEPEPVSGLTAQDVRQRLNQRGLWVFPMLADPGAIAFFIPLVDGGALPFLPFHDGDPGAALLQAVDVVTNLPVPMANGPRYARPGQAVRLDASGSFDLDAEVLFFAWDYDGDGTEDEITTSPTKEHVYPAAFTGAARIFVLSNDGGIGSTTIPVTIAESPLDGLVPPAPETLVATADDDGTALVEWPRPPSGQTVSGWVVTPSASAASAGHGSVVVPFYAEHRTETTMIDLPPGATVTFTVWPVDAAGRGQPAISDPIVVAGDPESTTTSSTSSSSVPCRPGEDCAGGGSSTTVARTNGVSGADHGRDRDDLGGSLPLTGAGVVRLVVLAVALIVAGGALLLRRRRYRSRPADVEREKVDR